MTVLALIGQVDVSAILATVIPITVSIIGGGLAMAWRLGGLEHTVEDLSDDVKEMKGQIRDLSQK